MPTITQEQIESITGPLTYSATYVPYSQSRNAGKWESLNWKVSIEANRQKIETDYAQGIGHLPKDAETLLTKISPDKGIFHRKQALSKMLEAGRSGKFTACYGGATVDVSRGGKAFPAPKLADVLHSLVSDADAIDHATFEDWCDCTGDDPDSRQAEATYRACLEIGLKLRSMLGDEKLSALRELFQDY